MRTYLWLPIILLSLFACKDKKKLTGNQHVEADEFFNAYNDIKLPFTVSDTNMKQLSDTNTISYTIFTQFISDTILNNPFGKDRKFVIHPIGKFGEKEKETYFITLVTGKADTAIYLSVYDKNKVMANMPLVISNNDERVATATIDKKLSISINREWTINNDIFYNRIIYAYNNVGLFTTVLTETNEDRRAEKTLSNPLDTFPKKYKYSGDYVKGNKNIVSVRDGRNPDEYLFFVYFESGSEGETCGGELRGTMKMVSEKAAIYQGEGDPCKLDFSFTSSQVKVKETGSCGNYRGIKCFFNDTYTRKKEIKAASKKNKT
ncbi:hypothetical protein [Segetibacter aerophilus]|uniref:Lipoprotein n=1 Tax=Segetibacter aerophilus TaxID=670293 RepID=A0A512BDH3_9BACT|nr:hypothetical protein [Segetibacter aerophilus]GEO10013.1 hypothetical protein SAE01_25090 [Segetibacter aerophilus]